MAKNVAEQRKEAVSGSDVKSIQRVGCRRNAMDGENASLRDVTARGDLKSGFANHIFCGATAAAVAAFVRRGNRACRHAGE